MTPDASVRARSPLLRELPPEPTGRSRRARAFRWSAAVVATGALAVVFLGTWYRWFPDRAMGWTLYWLWDHVVLRLRGILASWLWPWSLIYLVPWALLALYGVFGCFPARRPRTTRQHVRTARRLLRRPWGRRYVERWCRRHKRFADNPAYRLARRWRERIEGWRERIEGWFSKKDEPDASENRPAALPTLLETVLEHERRLALDRLDALDPGDPKAAAALDDAAELSLASARLLAVPPATPADRLRAIARIDAVLLRLELTRAARGSAAAEADEPRRKLLTAIAPLVRPDFVVRPGSPRFAARTLVADLALVLGLDGPAESADRRRRIVDAVEARRRDLDASRRKLESWLAFSRRRRSSPPPIAAPRSPLTARLALDVALFAALVYGAPRLGLAFVESFEGLRFLLLAAAPDSPHLDALGDLPEPFDYRVCADRLDRRLAAAADLAEAVERGSAVVTPADLELAAARQTELFAAAADPRQGRRPTGPEAER